MYIETSSPRSSGDKAILRSDPIIMGSSGELEFYYNMYGGQIGSLEVQVVDAQGTTHSAWKKAGNKGTAWHYAKVSLGSYAGNIVVQFVGVRGSSWQGDIAIDDVVVKSGGVSPTTAAPTTQPPTAAPTTQPPTVAPTTQPPTAAPTTQPPTVAPTTQPPTVAPTTQPPTAPPSDMVKKIDDIAKKVEEMVKLLKTLV